MSNIWFNEDVTEINNKEDFAGLWFNQTGETENIWFNAVSNTIEDRELSEDASQMPDLSKDDSNQRERTDLVDESGNTYDTSEITSTSMSSRFANKSYDDIKKGKPDFMEMIRESRQKGKFEGASDSDILKQMNEGWEKLNPPNGGPVDRKIKCGNCGGGKGVCILGGCFSGKRITWWL